MEIAINYKSWFVDIESLKGDLSINDARKNSSIIYLPFLSPDIIPEIPDIPHISDRSAEQYKL